MRYKRYEYLNDQDFLIKVDSLQIQEQYARIIVLDWSEEPIQEIQGIVTAGNLNLDGKSALRRTCNLSVFLAENEYNNLTDIENLFSLNKKMSLEIGIRNTTSYYTEYDILWFPQGLFVISDPSLNRTTGGVTLSLTCKDKMCLLNGDVGGALPASVTFHEYETLDTDGQYYVTKPTIVQIIQELVNHFGGEALSRILINDLDTKVKMVMRWMGTNSLYLIEKNNTAFMSTSKPTDESGIISIFQTGDDIGYVYTDFTYPDELIGQAGETICSILDKIKNTLGNYEYYYDIYGNFIFQEIKNYLNTSQAKIEIDKMGKSNYLIDPSKGKRVYNFTDAALISSYSNTPQYKMIKNDFIIWGMRKTVNDVKVPIRYHLAIDKKPQTGNIYQGFVYIDEDDGLPKIKKPVSYLNFDRLNRNPGAAGVFYLDQQTGKIYVWKNKKYVEYTTTDNMIYMQVNDWRSELYLQGVDAEPLGLESNYYYMDLINEWPKIYNMQASTTQVDGKTIYLGAFKDEFLEYPNNGDFFLDFIDGDAAMAKYGVSNIRPPHNSSK